MSKMKHAGFRLVKEVVTEPKATVSSKIATVIGIGLCAVSKGNKPFYRAVRHSLRSGKWDLVTAYKLSKMMDDAGL